MLSAEGSRPGSIREILGVLTQLTIEIHDRSHRVAVSLTGSAGPQQPTGPKQMASDESVKGDVLRLIGELQGTSAVLGWIEASLDGGAPPSITKAAALGAALSAR